MPPTCRAFPWKLWCGLAFAVSLGLAARAAPGKLVYQLTSAYHNLRVVDEGNIRSLCFDDAWESSISLKDPWRGHFEYTEYFHMPWLWNTNLTRVLMIGLGGASTQRAFAHYYPALAIDTVEIDPAVDADPRARYFDQAKNGLFVRMALLSLVGQVMVTVGLVLLWRWWRREA